MPSISEIISTFPSLKLTVEAHQLNATKALGQNFLLDQNITDKIINTSLQHQNLSDFHHSLVYEIGPGPGGLTRAVLKAEPEQFIVIEMDSRCISIMEELRSKTGNIMQIQNCDALKYDFNPISATDTHIVSNLPYNISVPLLIKWLNQINNFKSMTLMFQKEVADRIMAPTHCKDYGRISILSQLQCKISRLLDLNPQCFTPAPKIWSSVLLFQPLADTLSTTQISKLEKITSVAFSKRRKMIRQSLKSFSNLEEVCTNLGIETSARPEELSPQQFLALSEQL